jgi:hypothetical protein
MTRSIRKSHVYLHVLQRVAHVKRTGCNKPSCSRLVAINAVPTTCHQDVFALLVPSLLTSCQRFVDNLLQACTRLLSSTDLLQIVPTTCYRPTIQQFVNKLLNCRRLKLRRL